MTFFVSTILGQDQTLDLGWIQINIGESMDPIKLKSIRYPISIRAVEILLIVIILFIGGLFTFFEMKASIKTLEDNMLVTAKMLAATFNIDRLASLKGNLEDYNNPNYHHIRDQ